MNPTTLAGYAARHFRWEVADRPRDHRTDADGYFAYQARSDDMIVSAGYNIAGPEVEAALLLHPAVAECGVVAAPDEQRGHIVKA